MRGALLAVGRPDGRLNALASAEATCNLSVNQASSIQNWGVTLESFTLGHNPVKLGLSAGAVFLPRSRPLFICERVLESVDVQRSSAASDVMADLTALGKQSAEEMDADGDGVNDLFDHATVDGLGVKAPAQVPDEGKGAAGAPAAPSLTPLPENFLGAWMGKDERYCGLPTHELVKRQKMLQTLYETRCAALERFVGFAVIFYTLAKGVQDFWRWPLFLGQLKYDMSRTHSIMRVATTASPVSGMEARTRTEPRAPRKGHLPGRGRDPWALVFRSLSTFAWCAGA